jgi:hypothetical protein
MQGKGNAAVFITCGQVNMSNRRMGVRMRDIEVVSIDRTTTY